MNWRFRSPRRVQASRHKGPVALINVVHEHAADRPKDTVSCMAREQQLRPIFRQMSDSVGRLTICFFRPHSLEIKHFGIEAHGTFQIRRLDHGDHSHVDLQSKQDAVHSIEEQVADRWGKTTAGELMHGSSAYQGGASALPFLFLAYPVRAGEANGVSS